MTDLAREEEDLYRRVAELIEAARSHVARSVNTAMVHAYWHVGRELVEVEQQGKVRADYGERLIANLAQRLSERFGRGMGVATLRRIRRFYLTYPTGTAMPREVGGLDVLNAYSHTMKAAENAGASRRPMCRSRRPHSMQWMPTSCGH